MTDREFAEEIRRGNQQTFKLFVEKYQLQIIRVCKGFLHNQEDAEDVTQEVFTEVYLSIHKFRGDAKLSTWLHRIAVNKSLNYLRRNRIKKHLDNIESVFSAKENPVNAVEDKNNSHPAKSLEQSENARILHQAISSLPKNQRISFILNKFEDLSYKEIAEIMNTSLSAVESLIHRAKINLQKKLYNYFKKND
jgi:RNA polymerase sigma-70 factor (ECF subfamily)